MFHDRSQSSESYTEPSQKPFPRQVMKREDLWYGLTFFSNRQRALSYPAGNGCSNTFHVREIFSLKLTFLTDQPLKFLNTNYPKLSLLRNSPVQIKLKYFEVYTQALSQVSRPRTFQSQTSAFHQSTTEIQVLWLENMWLVNTNL